MLRALGRVAGIACGPLEAGSALQTGHSRSGYANSSSSSSIPSSAAARGAGAPGDQPRTKAASGWELEQQIYNMLRPRGPRRRQTYAPSELDPYKVGEEAPAPWEEALNALPAPQPRRGHPAADYKNAAMLSTFLSEAGKLPLRKRTHLRAKLHSHLARQVKIARCMGILSPTARWSRRKVQGKGGAREAAAAAAAAHVGTGAVIADCQRQLSSAP
ncbi:hypothetical protein ABPG77_004567 [Micractinium sp. CCAP 211/92]